MRAVCLAVIATLLSSGSRAAVDNAATRYSETWRIGTEHYMTDAAFARLTDFLKREQATGRCALFVATGHSPGKLELLKPQIEMMGRRCVALRKLGYAAGPNILCTIGQGLEAVELSAQVPGAQFMVGSEGGTSCCRHCMRDPVWREGYIKPLYEMLARAKPDFIWIDDDLRLNWNDVPGPACFCPRCLGLLKERLGFTGTHKDLAAFFADPKKGLVRRHGLLQLNREMFVDLYSYIGRVVRAVDPKIQLGIMCGGYGGLEGNCQTESVQALSPDGAPVLYRPGGGFYRESDGLGSMLWKANNIGYETARLPAQAITQSEIELHPKIMLYKSPRIIATESLAYIAAGASGTAWNFFAADIDSSAILMRPAVASRAQAQAMVAAAQGAPARGIWDGRGKNGFAGNRRGGRDGNWLLPNFETPSIVGSELQEIGLPLAYREAEADVIAPSADAVASWTNAEIERYLAKSLYLSADAVEELCARGYGDDIGFTAGDEQVYELEEEFADHPLNAGFVGKRRNSCATFLKGHARTLKPSVGSQVTGWASLYGKRTGEVVSGTFINRRGGRIYATGFFPYARMMEVNSVRHFRAVFDWLAGGALVGRVASYHRAVLFVRGNLVSVLNTSIGDFDDIEIVLRGEKAEHGLRALDGSGTILKGAREGAYTRYRLPAVKAWSVAAFAVKAAEDVGAVFQATPETLWTQYAAATNTAGSVLALAAGRYVLDRPLVFTQGVTLRGATDGETVLDGADKADRLVEIVHAGKDAFVFENLTFTHAKKQALAKGHVPYRGRGGLAVRNCRFRANGVGWNAGYVPAGRALYTSCASVTWGATTEIANCRFEDNAYFPAEKDGKGGKGGAVYIAGQSRAQLADCAFLRNGYSAELGEDAARYAGVMSGAALWAVNSPVTLERCVFDGNRSISMNENGWMYDSSAVMLENSQTHVPWTCAVTECRFTGNRSFSPNQWTGSSPTAGALFISDSVGATTATVTRCTFRNNHFDTAAGTAGVGVFGGNVILSQCTFEGNKTRPNAIGADVKATGWFAAVPARKTYVDVRDCVFSADANRVAAGGGAQLVPCALANPVRAYCNRCFKGLRTVWPEHVGYGDLRFENCRADEAPGIAPEWVRPICVETNRYIGWPTICRRKNGELIAVFSGDRTAHVSNDGKVQAVRSQDGGKTWSAPETWVNSAVDDRDSGLVELSDGTLVLFYFSSVCYAGTGYAKDFEKRIGCNYATAKASVGAFCRRSTDGGKTWGDPVRLRGIAPHGACVTKDGRLVLVSRCQRGEGNVLENDPAWETTKFALYVETSEDGGKSWTLRHSFEVPKGVDITKIHEPHVVEAADGSLVAQFRTSLFEGVLLQSISKDGGSNWSPLAPTTLHGHPAHLIRLADGRLLTTYGRRADHLKGGSGVYVALSSDNGRSWGQELKISNNAYNVYNFGYPATADLGDGAFLTVCYQQVAENDRPCLTGVRWHLR